MHLTPLQLEIQQWSDKTLSFGCLVQGGIYLGKGTDFPNSIRQIEQTHEPLSNGYQPFPVPRATEDNYRHQPEYIIGKPMDYGRLCWFHGQFEGGKPVKVTKELEAYYEAYYNIHRYFVKNPECYQQTVIDRPIELQHLVLAFLKILGPI